jgi:hypothetical protein
MSRGLRVALILAAITLFLCCVAGLGVTLLGTRLVGRAFIVSPARVQAVGREIADYEVPAGYQEMFAMNAMGAKLVSIGPADSASDGMMLMVVQFSGEVEISREEMERQVEQALTGRLAPIRADLAKVEEKEVTIRGEPVTLTVREGATESGERWRRVTVAFTGKGGPAMLIVTGQVSAWSQAAVDQFIASMR